MKSLSERALCEVENRLRSIRTPDGYATNAGLHVFRARRKLDEADLDALVVWDGGESNAAQAGKPHQVVLTVNIEAHVLADRNETGEALEAIKADVKRAVLSDTHGYLGDEHGEKRERQIGTIRYTGAQPSPREDGAISESLSVAFEIAFTEGCGNPYSAQDRT